MTDQELRRFKTDIDLRVYAVEHGFVLDRKESWNGSAVMRNEATGEKVVIKRDLDGTFIYFSVHDESDNGTIIDFAQHRLKISIGAVRKELRPWIGQSQTLTSVYAPLPKTSKDRMRVEADYSRTEAVTSHAYLEVERALPASLIASSRFANRIRKDARQNAVFPHFDSEGLLCGFELKNKDFTGFSPGGTKGLWLSQSNPDDLRLILAESAIDALSHAALFPDEHARYASIGGQVNPLQPELIRTAAARMPFNSEIVAAMDADAQGSKLAAMVREAVAMTGRSDLRFVMVEPFGQKDWNDVLKARPITQRIATREKPAVP